MEILYVYFLDTPNIRIGGEDINFGGSHRFKYNKLINELTVHKNPFYIEDFFCLSDLNANKAKILNVTSIVGENGAGKSSLLKLLKNNFASGLGGIRTPLIFACRNNNQLSVYHSEEIIIEKHNLETQGFSLHPMLSEKKTIKSKGKSFNYATPPTIQEFEHTDFIHFSNIFDGELEMQVSGLYELSTNFLIRNDFVKSVENQYINHETNQRQIDVHLFEEIERQISFIHRYEQKKIIPFELPKYIFLSTKKEVDFDFGYSREEKEILLDYGTLDGFLSLVLLLKNKIEQKVGKEKLLNYFIASTLLNFFLEMATQYRSLPDELKFNLNFLLVKNMSSLNTLAETLLDDITNQTNNFKIKMDEKHDKWIQGVRTFIIALPDLVQEEEFSAADLNSLALKITGSSKEAFKAFYGSYRNSYLLKPYLNFKWRSLSSGEKALLNIYSRFHSLSNSEMYEELKKNLIVLIDEGDVYLHPAWQKRFIYLLLEYLEEIYSKTKNGTIRNIQIVLTTNSAIPASDLPNDNTIFLEKTTSYLEDENIVLTKTIVKDSLNDQKETFAANIYTLLSDSFFIKNGLIGDFATEKINDVIKELSSGYEISFERRESIRRTIQQIGEPILKHKLFQMYNDRFNLSLHERLDKIEKHLKL